MITDKDDFRTAVETAVRAVERGKKYASAAVREIMEAAEEYAPIYAQERAEEARASGSAACSGSCCTGSY